MVDLSRFQEGFLRFLVKTKLGVEWPETSPKTQDLWDNIKKVDLGKLYEHLQTYSLPKGGKLKNLEGFPTRPVLMAILEYYQQEFANLLEPLRQLNDYCEQRNRCVHSFEGVSELENAGKIVKILREILRQQIAVPNKNPFNVLNSKICSLLTQCLHS